MLSCTKQHPAIIEDHAFDFFGKSSPNSTSQAIERNASPEEQITKQNIEATPQESAKSKYDIIYKSNSAPIKDDIVENNVNNNSSDIEIKAAPYQQEQHSAIYIDPNLIRKRNQQETNNSDISNTKSENSKAQKLASNQQIAPIKQPTPKAVASLNNPQPKPNSYNKSVDMQLQNIKPQLKPIDATQHNTSQLALIASPTKKPEKSSEFKLKKAETILFKEDKQNHLTQKNDSSYEKENFANKSEHISISSQQTEKFIWPLRGEIVAPFNSKSQIHGDGIHIRADTGSIVRSASAGKVVYSGNQLSSYGNMVIIAHDNGFVSAYGYLGRILVNVGDYVKKGSAIGTITTENTEEKANLYFAIRKNREPVDPMRYM